MFIQFLLITAVLPQISESIFSPCLPDIAQSFSESMSAVEHVFTTYLVGYALGMFFWGSLSDYLGRIKTLQIGLITYLVGAILCYGAPSLNILLFSRFIQGLGGSACAVLVITLCRDYFEEEKRARMMGRLGMALSIGPMIGPIMGSSILAFLPWHFIYLPLIIYAMGIFSATYYVPHVEKESIKPNFSQYYDVLGSREIWRYAILIGHACGIGFSFFSEAPFFFTQALGMPKEYFFLCFIIVGWSWYIGGEVSQRMLATQSIRRVMYKGVLFSLFSSVMFCLACTLLPANILLLVVSLICVFGIMLGLGLVIGNAISLALEPYAAFSGVASSTLGLLYYSVIAFVAALMAELHNGTIYTMPFYWLYVVGVCAILVYRLQIPEDTADSCASVLS